MFGMAMEWLRLLNNRKLPPDELTKLQNKKLRSLIPSLEQKNRMSQTSNKMKKTNSS